MISNNTAIQWKRHCQFPTNHIKGGRTSNTIKTRTHIDIGRCLNSIY